MTNIDDNDLLQSLLYLCSSKQTIIERQNANKKSPFSPVEMLKINSSFSNPNIRIFYNIPSSTPKVKAEVYEKQQEEIKKDRNNQIDAAIVRVIKSRIAEKQTPLIEEVMR